jgi:nitric oxide dioxygenase
MTTTLHPPLPALTPRQKRALRHSLGLIAGDPAGFSAAFYARLFEMDGSLRPLFVHDMGRQGFKLVQMLAFCIKYLDHPAVLIPEVRLMAVRHTAYHVQEAHYAVVGEALLWTIRDRLGENTTADMLAAWQIVYAQIAAIAVEWAYHTDQSHITTLEMPSIDE